MNTRKPVRSDRRQITQSTSDPLGHVRRQARIALSELAPAHNIHSATLRTQPHSRSSGEGLDGLADFVEADIDNVLEPFGEFMVAGSARSVTLAT